MRVLVVIVIGAVVTAAAVVARTADEPLDAAERTEVVERISTMLETRYVLPDVGSACADRLRAGLADGVFDALDSRAAFAEALTETLYRTSSDGHLHVRVRPPEALRVEREDPVRARAREHERLRRENYGFARVERLDGNIGYLDTRYFSGSPRARPVAAAAMRFLADADALIVDLRRNGGGNPAMIRFLCSYLFDEPVHLYDIYWREGERTEEHWTLRDVPGPRQPDVPVYVLTSADTFSGAEGFAYTLRGRGRATIVGEQTRGGANPGRVHPVSARFDLFIPAGRVIDAVTGTNWEGVGLTPDVATPADEALAAALVLARVAAAERAREREAALEALCATLTPRQIEAIRHARAGRHADAEAAMTAVLREAHAAELMEERDVNALGYDLLTRDCGRLAIAVFRFNTTAYPDSANAHDSLAEAYAKDGQRALALDHYRRALELDPDNRHAARMIDRLRQDGSEE